MHLRLRSVLRWVLLLWGFLLCQSYAQDTEQLTEQYTEQGKAQIRASLIQHLQVLSSAEFAGRQPGTIGHQKAQQYLSQHLHATHINGQHINQTFQYKFRGKSKQGVNIIYAQKGEMYPNQSIVITAHYDHLGEKNGHIFYGADDNASGTAMLLQIKRWLETQTLAYSVYLVALDAEEDDLNGAKAFLKQFPAQNETLKININLDMLAYGHRQKYMYVVGLNRNPELKGIIDQLNKQSSLKFKPKYFIKADKHSVTSQRINLHKASDHYAFHKQGIPYLFITGENHKNYHSPNDTFARVDQNFYANVFWSLITLIQIVDSSLN